jgi:DNA-binding MarR family transcriptional regulator
MIKPDMKRSHDAAMGLRMAYWAMHRRTDENLADRNVTANQFVLLALLMEEDGITQQDLVFRASSDPSTIRAMLVLLEKKGLIVRHPHAEDGRAQSVTLTGKGRRLYKQMWADTQSVRQRLSVMLKPTETIFLVELLARIANAMNSPLVRKSSQRRTTNGKGESPETTGEDAIIPGCWECPQCGFFLTRGDLDFKRGTMGQVAEPFSERCPNDGQILKPETWKARCGRLTVTCEQLLTEIRRLNDFCRFKRHPRRPDCKKKIKRFG